MFSARLCAEESLQVVQQINEKRTITLKGKMDPRLSVWVKSTYKPTNFTNVEECLSKNPQWTTGRKKGLLDWKIVNIIPDENNKYEVNIPIDYVNENKCGYEYSATEIEVRRDNDDDLWASFTVASSKNKPFNVYQGTKTGSSNSVTGGRPFMPENTRKHFQLPSNTQITCLTTFYPRIGRGDNLKRDHVTFACFEEYEGTNNGVDELKTTSINLDIRIDEERCLYIFPYDDPKNRGKKKKDYFRDYYELTTFEELKQSLKKIFD